MDRLNNLPTPRPPPVPNPDALSRKINTIAALGLIIVATLVATSLFVINFQQSGQAVAADAPELRAAEVRVERGGIWHQYDILY
jgi:hypothetical protein